MLWQPACDDHLPNRLKTWVSDPGSTCSKLKAQGGFELMFCECKASVLSDLNRFKHPAFERTAVLSYQNQPWMVAQSWMINSNEHAHWIKRLASHEPLGDWIYDPQWQFKRTDFEWSFDDSWSDWVRSYVAVKAWVARRSYFQQSGYDKLCLIEVFLEHAQWHED